MEISGDQLKTLLNSPIVHSFILEADYALYQYIVDILLPKVLKPIPNSLTQCIRTFSKSLENWMNSALNSVPEQLKLIKVNCLFLIEFAQVSLKLISSGASGASSAQSVIPDILEYVGILWYILDFS